MAEAEKNPLVDARPSDEKNWLSEEKSPYLLQHEKNPVNWYPWSNTAFERAARENKPVFLSIGYSTCHWCHVMERESFEDPEVASLLNEHFISIKVDREERPDIDSIYMNICQLLNGEGGWPLNVFLTPEQKPFYAGTYFPKTGKYGRPGMMDVLPQLYAIYRDNPSKIQDISSKLTEALQPAAGSSQEEIPNSVFEHAYAILRNEFDPIFGGFGKAPKFPTPSQLLFLLRYFHTTGEQLAYDMVKKTLNGIADGGIYDHLGSGFARYSTDQQWLVPHFEKMLYDQAQLLSAYTEAYLIKPEPRFKKIIYDTIEFIEREMTHPDGGFYSAIDADSEGAEGTYYLWTADEISEILGTARAEIYADVYNITLEGNFEGRNIPNLIGTNKPAIAEKYGYSPEQLEQQMESCRRELLAEREKRPYPHLDDKILTAWNGMTIAALAKAGAAFSEPRFIEMAEKAVSFIDQELRKNKGLFARFRDGEARHLGYLDDYAHFLSGHLELFLATGNPLYLNKSRELANEIFHRFEDSEHHGFFFTDKDTETLIVRDKSILDSAMPSGNGVAILQLWRLAKLDADSQLLVKAERAMTSFADEAVKYPTAVLSLLMVRMAFGAGGKEIVISGASEADKENMMEFILTTYRPFDVWLVADAEMSALTEGKVHNEQPIAIYICENSVCKMPLFDVEDAQSRLQ
ncbi:thioredoxin domain-containing protein [Planococcus shenhongbingii]|uniref:Thioredoxin domain-containing protein n=1 Tax=Planococcus shenhongbingii TaxID=3058398 RepID=A0ABT8N9B0_9BACL|nr:thioredoxin domain-containing protein [Planococcus sp. N017]MDN7244482.1 thioredoxin domain-containing protein [Planococcus sp. N017]